MPFASDIEPQDVKTVAVIRLYAMEPLNLTTKEYEQLTNEVCCNALLDSPTLGQQILARMLIENLPRYYEAKQTNKARGIDT